MLCGLTDTTLLWLAGTVAKGTVHAVDEGLPTARSEQLRAAALAAAASTTEPAAEPAVAAAAAAAVVPTTTAADADAALTPQPLSGEQNARLVLALADPSLASINRGPFTIMKSQLATLHAGGADDANSACNDEFVNVWLSFLVDRHRRQVDRSFANVANVYDSLADARSAVAIKKLYWQLVCHQQVLPYDLIETVGMQIELKVEFKLPSIYCAPTTLYTRMASNYHAFNYAFVQRWTKTKQGTVPIISSHDLIFIPVVCVGWGLAVVNMHAKTIQFFQSFAPSIHVRRYVFLQFFQSFAAPNISCISTTVE